MGAIVAIGHGSLVGAAERAVEPDIDVAAGVMGGIEAYLHRGPALPAAGRAGRSAPASPSSAGLSVCRWPPAHAETHALAEQRASILKKGLVLHDFLSLKESCLI